MEHPRSHRETAPSFPLFQHLPAELRIRIWTLSFEPRIIELRVKWRQLANNTEALIFNTLRQPPTSLSINSESRCETLRHYHLAFESKDHYPNTSPRIYINFSLDTIYLDSQTFDLLHRPHRPHPHIGPLHALLRFLDAATKSNTSKIQHLAIDQKIWLANLSHENVATTGLPSGRESILAENAKAIRHFTGLKDLTIVHHGVNFAVPCTYSYLRAYELHNLYIRDKNAQWPLLHRHHQYYHRPPQPNTTSDPDEYNIPNPEIFIRYLDKPRWNPVRKPWPPVLRGNGMGVRNPADRREWDEIFNEAGEVPIFGAELESLEGGELRFFGLVGEDFMDGVRRGCVEEDRMALEREGVGGLNVRSVGLIRGGEEC